MQIFCQLLGKKKTGWGGNIGLLILNDYLKALFSEVYQFIRIASRTMQLQLCKTSKMLKYTFINPVTVAVDDTIYDCI